MRHAPCRHLRAATGDVRDHEDVYTCAVHRDTTRSQCIRCREFARRGVITAASLGLLPNAGESQQPDGMIVDRYERPARVADLFWGAQAFLVLGGPSLKQMDLTLLAQRGVLIVSTNNCPAALPPGVRPHVWIHTDPPHKFHDSLWRDPAVLKFTPVKEWNPGRKNQKLLRHRDEDGNLQRILELPSRDCPGVFGYHRNSALDPEKFLFEDTINRGNDQEHSDGGPHANGMAKGLNTMYSALRLSFHLGIRTLYLLGADFKMARGSPYAFNQGKGDPGIKSNNSAYLAMNLNLERLQKHFLQHQFHVFNCTPGSNLWTFPELSYEEALRRATAHFEEPLNCQGWYDPLPDAKSP